MTDELEELLLKEEFDKTPDEILARLNRAPRCRRAVSYLEVIIDKDER